MLMIKITVLMINLLLGPGVLMIKITDTDDKSSPWTRRAADKDY